MLLRGRIEDIFRASSFSIFLIVTNNSYLFFQNKAGSVPATLCPRNTTTPHKMRYTYVTFKHPTLYNRKQKTYC